MQQLQAGTEQQHRETLNQLGHKLAGLRKEYNTFVRQRNAGTIRMTSVQVRHCVKTLHETLARFVPLHRALRALLEPSQKLSVVSAQFRWTSYVRLFDALHVDVQRKLQLSPFDPTCVYPDMQAVLLPVPDVTAPRFSCKEAITVRALCEQEAATLKREQGERAAAYQQLVRSLTAEQREWLKVFGHHGTAVITTRDL